MTTDLSSLGSGQWSVISGSVAQYEVLAVFLGCGPEQLLSHLCRLGTLSTANPRSLAGPRSPSPTVSLSATRCRLSRSCQASIYDDLTFWLSS